MLPLSARLTFSVDNAFFQCYIKTTLNKRERDKMSDVTRYVTLGVVFVIAAVVGYGIYSAVFTSPVVEPVEAVEPAVDTVE